MGIAKVLFLPDIKLINFEWLVIYFGFMINLRTFISIQIKII